MFSIWVPALRRWELHQAVKVYYKGKKSTWFSLLMSHTVSEALTTGLSGFQGPHTTPYQLFWERPSGKGLQQAWPSSPYKPHEETREDGRPLSRI